MLLEEAAHTGGEEEMPCAAQTLGVTGEREGCKDVLGFHCLEIAEADLNPKERKGADEGRHRGEEKVPD